MKKYLIPTIAALLLSACSSNDDNDPQIPTEPERSVLIYMAGENNLSSFADQDLTEIKEGSKSLKDNQNLIVYVDNTKKPYMARVKDGVLVDSVDMEESSSADPAMMENIIRQMRTKYPAKSYGMVLWGHCTGWLITNDSIPYAGTRAYGVDQKPKSYWMNIPSMARAIAKGMNQEKMKFIFGDCCNFGSIEIAYELRNAAEYIIGSPAEIPDPGAPYEEIMPDLFSQNDNFYQALIDDYYNHYIKAFKEDFNYFYNRTPGDLDGYSEPLSAIRTSALEELAQATANLLSTIPEKLKPEGELDFNGVTFYAWNVTKLAYDMSQALKKNTSASAYATWESVFKKAIAHKAYSQRWLVGISSLSLDSYMKTFDTENAGVVSMFFPLNDYSSTTPKWNSAIQQYQWNKFIQWAQYGW
jgi:hypothetical protein